MSEFSVNYLKNNKGSNNVRINCFVILFFGNRNIPKIFKCRCSLEANFLLSIGNYNRVQHEKSTITCGLFAIPANVSCLVQFDWQNYAALCDQQHIPVLC